MQNMIMILILNLSTITSQKKKLQNIFIDLEKKNNFLKLKKFRLIKKIKIFE